jgi:hypothetical protein
MNNNQKITVPEIRWPDFTPPPQREGMRWTGRIEIRPWIFGETIFNCGKWEITVVDGEEYLPVIVAIYEPAQILCPECGAEMKPVHIHNCTLWSMCCSCNRFHFAGPCKPTESEAISSTECLRGLWEKKQKEKVE